MTKRSLHIRHSFAIVSRNVTWHWDKRLAKHGLPAPRVLALGPHWRKISHYKSLIRAIVHAANIEKLRYVSPPSPRSLGTIKVAARPHWTTRPHTNGRTVITWSCDGYYLSRDLRTAATPPPRSYSTQIIIKIKLYSPRIIRRVS